MKKLLSIALCVIMVLSIIPIGALAASPIGSMYNPLPITFGKTYSSGWNGDDDHLNYYMSFTTTKKGLVTLEFTKPYDDEGEIGSINFNLYDNYGECVWSHSSYEEKDAPKPTTKYTIGLPAGEYLLNVTPDFYVTSGFIDFQHTITFNATNYCESEPNGSVATATSLELGKFYKGSFGSRADDDAGDDENDFYKFKVSKGVKYRVRFKDVRKLEASTAILDLLMNGSTVDDFYGFYDIENNYDSAGYPYVDFVAPSSGYAYLKFDNYHGTPIEYEVEISKIPVKCSAPSLKKVSNDVSGVKVTWGKVSGADKYVVYRKVKGGSWETVGSSTSTSLVDKKAKSGTTYYYTVRAYNGAGGGSYNTTGLAIKYVATPKLTKIANSNKYVQINWNKVGGASGYVIYRKASGDSGSTKIATIKSGSTVAYKDTKVSSGKTYTYTVKAYSGNAYSANAATLSIKYLAMPTVTVANAGSGITVKWSKSAGASGYYVYRKTTGGWSKIATIKGNSTFAFTDKTAKAGTTYKYAVRAYSGSIQSYYNTSGIAIKRLTAPTLSKVTSSKSGVTVSWAKVTGASGYIVFRKTGSGDWVNIGKVEGNAKVSYLDKTAKKGVTYSYTVKAYSGSYKSAHNTKGLTIKDKY